MNLMPLVMNLMPSLAGGSLVRTSGTDAMVVSGTMAGTDLFSHAYEDVTVFSSSNTGAYCSYDTLAHMQGALAYNHFFGYEARQNFAGSTSVTVMGGFITGMTTSGAANLVRHFAVADIGGVGVVQSQYGLYVPNLTRGVHNYGVYLDIPYAVNTYAIYSPNTAPAYFGGEIKAVGGLTVSLGFTTFSLDGAHYVTQTMDNSGVCTFNLSGTPVFTLASNGQLTAGTLAINSILTQAQLVAATLFGAC